MKKFTFILIILLLTLSYSARTQQASALHNIQLQEGYNFVSTYISPDDPDLMELLEDLLFDGSLEFVRNSAGQMFHKVGWYWVNNIGDWNTQEGYLFFMNSPAEISIEGELFDPTTPLNLDEGYQFAPFYYTEYTDVLEASSEILDNLDFIRNTEGLMFRKIGPHWINNIGDFRYGEAYLIKMNNADELIYVTDTTFNCPSSFIDPRDGQEYEAVMIGDQCWMAENLNIGTMVYGDQLDNGIIEKYCYNNDTSFCDEYGALYQWHEMMNWTSDTAGQGICPQIGNWHVPTDFEWKVLEGFTDTIYGIGDPEWDNVDWRGFDAGKNLKSVNRWDENNGTDLYSFNAIPAGMRHPYGYFFNIGISTSLWTSTQDIILDFKFLRDLLYSQDKVYRESFGFNDGYSVRCMKQ
ncbi:MAG: hypothetical protein JEY97_02115 [Bacteroidales bacterium]|nr:hypothetical protein [Bacteroidales bacterium]